MLDRDAPNKLLAKIASDMQKPDGLLSLPRLTSRPAYGVSGTKALGVGPKTEAHPKAVNINTIGELASLPLESLFEEFKILRKLSFSDHASTTESQ